MPNPIVKTLTIDGTTYDLSGIPLSHTHGNITNSGDITTTVAIASGDRLVINDESNSKINNSSITFGSNASQYLANNGTWQNIPDVSTVMTYKGTKTSTIELPSSGNKTGDVWHITIDGSEWAWDGSQWQELGTGIDIPTDTGSSTTGISIADHSTGSIIGVQSTTTSVRGVKIGTNSTTTASKVTFGTAFSIPNPSFTDVTVPIRDDSDTTVPTAASSATTVPIRNTSTTTIPTAASSATTVPIRDAEPTVIPNVTSAGSASNWTFGDITVPIRADSDVTVPTAASSATTVPIKATSATTVPIKDTSATSCDDITAWSQGDLELSMDSTDTKKLVISFTKPSLSYTERSICGVQSTTTSVTGVQSTTTSVTGVSGSTTVRGVKTGTNSTTTASHVTGGGNGTAPTLGTAISIYGVQEDTTSVTGVNGSTSIYGVQSTTTSVTGVSGSTTVRGVKTGTSSTTTASKATLGTAFSVPNPSASDVTVPIRADSDTTVPIKDTNSTTVVTSGTHTITDNGHTHSI